MRLAAAVLVVFVVMFPVLMGMPILMEMFVRVMKMHVSFSNQLAEEIVNAEEKERSSRDAGKPGAHPVTHYRAK